MQETPVAAHLGYLPGQSLGARARAGGGAASARSAPGENARTARVGRESFGTIKARMGATHFLMKTLPKVAAKMPLSVLVPTISRVF
jgi:hypothetical protein